MTTSVSTRRLGAALASATVAAVAAGTLAAPAQAAPARDLRPVVSFYGATVEACQVRVDGGRKVQLFLRLDNTRNRGDATRDGFFQVARDGELTDKRVDILGVRAGTRSRVRSMTFSVGGTIEVSMGIGTGQMGRGRGVPLRQVRAC